MTTATPPAPRIEKHPSSASASQKMVEEIEAMSVKSSDAGGASPGSDAPKAARRSVSLDGVFQFLEKERSREHKNDRTITDEDATAARASPSFADKLYDSLSTLADAIRVFGAQQMLISFNGGKEASVLLFLFLVVTDSRWAQTCSDTTSASSSGAVPATCTINSPSSAVNDTSRSSSSGTTSPMRAVHFVNPDEFPEILQYVSDIEGMLKQDSSSSTTSSSATKRTRHVVLERTSAGWRDGISSIVERARPQTLCFAIGTRKTDPNAGSRPERFEPSSAWLGPNVTFMRVNPILDWSYHDVWYFLRAFDLPYCALYDQGYTSIGTVKNTRPNEALRISPSDTDFRPAWTLEDESLERAGRGVA
ncbi:unnamed protein product [Amoebophrya sp. A25]|nr:unnamed protein product [Amoebophrya sp. A25]|eukprot:GSA25T00000233001.1